MERNVSRAIALMASIIAIGLASSGCRDVRAPWIGTWTGERILENESTIPVEMRTTLKQVKLTIKPDETFELVQAGIPYSGRADLHDKKATIAVTTIFGKPVSDSGEGAVKQNLPIQLTMDSPQYVSLVDPGAFQGGTVRLSKIAESK
jgi:hypothetical protein